MAQVAKRVRDSFGKMFAAMRKKQEYERLLTERGALQKLQLDPFQVKRFQDRVLRIEQNFERVMRRIGRE